MRYNLHNLRAAFPLEFITGLTVLYIHAYCAA
jgi:hypothetical protein